VSDIYLFSASLFNTGIKTTLKRDTRNMTPEASESGRVPLSCG